MPAVRNIPYGIQQPAVSAQVAQLEEFLGVTLFQRRPFALTPAGEKLFAFIQPFFSNLGKIAAEFQGGQARHFRIGASTIVLRDHLPKLLQGVRKKFPGLKLSLREGYPAQLEELLAAAKKENLDFDPSKPVAIGLSGLPGVEDWRGRQDLYGYSLQHTEVGVADQIASAATLLLGQAAEAIPAVLVRGAVFEKRNGSAQEINRPKDLDLFR